MGRSAHGRFARCRLPWIHGPAQPRDRGAGGVTGSGSAFEATLRAAQAEAEWAISALYRDHNPRLLRYLRTQAPSEYADIASDSWLDAARNLKAFQGDEDQFRGWLFTIARRRLIDHRRARGRRPVDPVVHAALEQLSTESAEQAAFAERLGDEAAARILDLLPPDQAEVVLLRVISGLDIDTVARMTGRRPATVRVMQHRALKSLAKKLGGSRNESAPVGDGTQRDANAPTPPR